MDGFATSALCRDALCLFWTSVQCEIFLLFFIFRFRPKKEGLFIFLLFFGRKIQCFFCTFSFSAENRNSVFGQPLPLGLFSKLVPADIKHLMVAKLLDNHPKEQSDRSTRYTGKDYISNNSLDHFIGPSSHFYHTSAY